MAAKRSNRTTIVIAPEIRADLKHIARKDQTYNEIIADLIRLHRGHTVEIEKSGLEVTQNDHAKPNPSPDTIATPQTKQSDDYD